MYVGTSQNDRESRDVNKNDAKSKGTLYLMSESKDYGQKAGTR